MRADWPLGAAQWAIGDGDEADRHVAESLARCRVLNPVEMDADILLDLAQLRAALTRGPSVVGGGAPHC